MTVRLLPIAAAIALLAGCSDGESATAGRKRDPGWQAPVSSVPPTPEAPPVSTQPPGDIPEPCSFVPLDKVGSIYGAPATVEWSEPTGDNMSKMCMYRAGDAVVTLNIAELPRSEVSKTPKDVIGGFARGKKVVVIAGLGDLAGYVDGPLGTVYVVNKTGKGFSVAMVSGSPEERSQMIEFAKALGPRL